MYMKTVGLDPADHAVKRELERVELYRAKVDKAAVRLSEKKMRSKNANTKLDVAAADRFIQHQMGGELSAEQKAALKAKNAGGGAGNGSAAEEAEAFLGGLTETPDEKKGKRKSTSGGGGGGGGGGKSSATSANKKGKKKK